MGGQVKAGVFALFCAGLFFALQSSAATPLAYFAFFPIGAIGVFYFYGNRDWVLFGVALALLLGVYFFRRLAVLMYETATLGGGTVSCFSLLAYYWHGWQKTLGDEEKRYERVRSELFELKERHATRVESLLHLEKQVASLINLFEIARDFNECLDLKETAQIIFKKVLPGLPFEKAELVLLASEENHKTISRTYLISKMGVEEKVSLDPKAPEYEWLDRISGEKRFVSVDHHWFFPLVLENEFNGIFMVQGSDKEDLAKFEVLASQLTLQVRKVRLYEMVRALSIIDGLTGVFVRRHFLERFEEEIRRGVKHNFPLSVLMLDIDHFKRYNDEFGHLVGDATLREVVQVVRANVRNVDIVARYGGEEFVVVIPETGEQGALEVAERIRSAVARRAFRVYDEETKVTVSIGISIFPQDLSPQAEEKSDANLIFDLLQKADRALYRAKEEGRNRVVAYHSLGEKGQLR